MDTENNDIMVLDEGVEESLGDTTTCCKVSMAALTPPK
jgi:hypothetical protein